MKTGNPPPPRPPAGPPPITLKYIGWMDVPKWERPERTSRRVSAIARATMRAREGEIVAGQYRLVRIGVESVVMEYVVRPVPDDDSHVRQNASVSSPSQWRSNGVPVLKPAGSRSYSRDLLRSGAPGARLPKVWTSGAWRRLGHPRQGYTKAGRRIPTSVVPRIALESGDAERRARPHHLATIESKDQLDAGADGIQACAGARSSNRLAEARATELERTIRDRIEPPGQAAHSMPSRGSARATRRCSARLPPPCRGSVSARRQRPRHPDFIGTSTGINVT